MTDPLSLLLNIAFLILLYLLLWRAVRLISAQLRSGVSEEAPARPAYLRIVESNQSIPLLPRTLIGRDSNCTLKLDDDFASSEHASIDWDGRQWTLRDLGSTNGTLLSGKPVREARLSPGDRIQIGQTSFIFEA